MKKTLIVIDAELVNGNCTGSVFLLEGTAADETVATIKKYYHEILAENLTKDGPAPDWMEELEKHIFVPNNPETDGPVRRIEDIRAFIVDSEIEFR